MYPNKPQSGRLCDLWEGKVSELVSLPDLNLTEEEKERHRIYSSLLLSILISFWNGNKRGPGTYHWQKNPEVGNYLGHNIAALAVDGNGEVIDFEFNHNELFNSSAEHAEARLVRRIFSLAGLYDGWQMGTKQQGKNYSAVLTDVTIYTTLESCSQCSGIMALGLVKAVVFLQRDPGQSSIGNILHNLGPIGDKYLPPLPIPGDYIDMQCFSKLEKSYKEYVKVVSSGTPYWTSPKGIEDKSTSITSFLCTDNAKEIFMEETAMNNLRYPDYKPNEQSLNNSDVLIHTQRFLQYVITCGKRGTPHRD